MIYPYKVKYDGIYYEAGMEVPSDVKGVDVESAPITITEEKEEVVVATPKKTRKRK